MNSKLFELAKGATENYIQAGKEEQEALDKIMGYVKNGNQEDDDNESKLKLPEVDTITTITPVNDWSQDTYLGENQEDNVYIWSCKKAENTFNDDIFTVNNYKIVEPKENGTDPIPQGYFAAQHNRTESLAYEFDVACQRFAITGCGGFRLSVWDESKNKWKYVQSSTGIADEGWAWYLVTFPDAKKRTVRVEALECFIGLVVKRDDVDKVTKTTRQPGKRVLFVGNSWTNATLGTEIEGRRGRLYDSYVNVLSEALGFECMNDGIGGTGYSVPINGDENTWKLIWYQNRIKCMVENGLPPDIIIVGGAGNDIFERAADPARVATEAQNCINEVNELNKKNNTNIKLIMIGVEKVADDDIKQEFKDNAGTMNDLIKQVALENHVPFIDFLTNTSIASDGKTITTGATPFVLAKYIGADNLHPTLQGHKEIGLRLAEEVQAILKYEKW